jgi:hypothetical protein
MKNTVKSNYRPIDFFPYIAFLLSFLLVYIGDSLLAFSPSILLLLSLIVINFFYGRLFAGIDFFIVFPLFLLIIIMSENQNTKELARVLYIYGGITLAYYYKYLVSDLSQKSILKILFFILTLDLTLRIFISSDFSHLSIYSIKEGGGLYSDSNYSAIFIIVAMIELFEKKKKIFNWSLLLMLFFLIMTVSRTAWFMLVFYMFSIRYMRISVFIIFLSFLILLLLVIFPNYLNFDLRLIDGSFYTKYLILQSFSEFMHGDLGDILMGYGRNNEQLLESYGYTGHTLFGQIVQYGFIQVLLLTYILYKYLGLYASNPNAMFLMFLFGGIFSFFPSSYFGLIVLISSAVKFSK